MNKANVYFVPMFYLFLKKKKIREEKTTKKAIPVMLVKSAHSEYIYANKRRHALKEVIT